MITLTYHIIIFLSPGIDLQMLGAEELSGGLKYHVQCLGLISRVWKCVSFPQYV